MSKIFRYLFEDDFVVESSPTTLAAPSATSSPNTSANTSPTTLPFHFIFSLIARRYCASTRGTPGGKNFAYLFGLAMLTSSLALISVFFLRNLQVILWHALSRMYMNEYVSTQTVQYHSNGCNQPSTRRNAINPSSRIECRGTPIPSIKERQLPPFGLGPADPKTDPAILSVTHSSTSPGITKADPSTSSSPLSLASSTEVSLTPSSASSSTLTSSSSSALLSSSSSALLSPSSLASPLPMPSAVASQSSGSTSPALIIGLGVALGSLALISLFLLVHLLRKRWNAVRFRTALDFDASGVHQITQYSFGGADQLSSHGNAIIPFIRPELPCDMTEISKRTRGRHSIGGSGVPIPHSTQVQVDLHNDDVRTPASVDGAQTEGTQPPAYDIPNSVQNRNAKFSASVDGTHPQATQPPPYAQ